MRYAMLLLALMLWAPIEIAAQTCQRDLANLSVPRSNYKMVEGAPFEQRVYVYTPQYSAMPFQLWIVEGVYGRPFLQPTGPLGQAEFDRLRQSSNVRATSVTVATGNGSDWGRFRLGRNEYQVQVLRVGGEGVQLRVCQ